MRVDLTIAPQGRPTLGNLASGECFTLPDSTNVVRMALDEHRNCLRLVAILASGVICRLSLATEVIPQPHVKVVGEVVR